MIADVIALAHLLRVTGVSKRQIYSRYAVESTTPLDPLINFLPRRVPFFGPIGSTFVWTDRRTNYFDTFGMRSLNQLLVTGDHLFDCYLGLIKARKIRLVRSASAKAVTADCRISNRPTLSCSLQSISENIWPAAVRAGGRADNHR
jgi:hypothetical protein